MHQLAVKYRAILGEKENLLQVVHNLGLGLQLFTFQNENIAGVALGKVFEGP